MCSIFKPLFVNSKATVVTIALLLMAGSAKAGSADNMFCALVQKEVEAAIKAKQSGTSLQSAIANIHERTSPNTNPVWTQKRINLVEGIYASKQKLNSKDESMDEKAICEMLGPKDYMATVKNPNHTWAESSAESEKKINEIERDIARLDRELAANQAAMDQLKANTQYRLQAEAAADAAEAAVKRQAKRQEFETQRRTRTTNCLITPMGSGMALADCDTR